MKFPHKCFLILLIYCSVPVYSQVNLQWRSFYNGSANDTDIVSAFTIDESGNVYVTGFSIGSGTGKDFATVKYDHNGQQIWVNRYNNDDVNGNDLASAIAVDAVGNVYVTGQSAGNGTYKDYYTIKYSSGGDQLWSARYNGKGNDDDAASAITIDGLGNVYITGSSVGAISSEDFATIKYNSAGEEEWIAVYNSEFFDVDIATNIVLDHSGNVIVTGFSIGKSTEEDYATVKYNSQGDELWSSRYNAPSSGFDITSALTIDASDNVYVTGFSYDSLTSEDYATVKYDESGKEQWVSRFNGKSNDFDIATAINVDANENVYVTGYSYNSKSSEDYATVKYDSEGNEQWVSIFNGKGNDYDIATAIKMDDAENIYVTGFSYNEANAEDYATIKYDADGNELWTEIFDGKTGGSDISTSLAIDAAGNVYVTGYSYDGPTSVDYVTIKYSQTVGITQTGFSIPSDFKLRQNYPNPFNPVTNIEFEIPASGYVSLKVYDMLGREVTSLINSELNAGIYKYSFDASEISGGVYFYRLSVNPGGSDLYSKSVITETKKMLVVK